MKKRFFLSAVFMLSACSAAQTVTPKPQEITAASFASAYKEQCLADPEVLAGLDNAQLCDCSERKLQEALSDATVLKVILNQPEAKEVADLYVRIGTECSEEQIQKPEEK